jgi:streptogramin lyase
VKYLAANFGPNAELRDLQPDPLVRDEDALSRTVFVQYELPPVTEAALKALPRVKRGIHDVFPSPTMPGVIWLAGVGSSTVLKIDTRNPDPVQRVKEWFVQDDRKINVGVHGVVETHGHVYWTELAGDHIGELDIKTEQIRRYPSVTPAGAHTPRADSKGNIWFSDVSAGGKIGLWDAETKKTSEFEPIKGANYYGIVVDKKDRVFVAGTTKDTLVMWDPKAREWSNLHVPENVRRVALDSKDNVWACAYMGNSVMRVDANTLKVTEFRLPLKNGNPYAVYVDKEDNVWLENAVYNSFVKFDPKTQKFTYFPFPELSSHTPNMEMDSEGTVWFGMGEPSQLTGLKLNGNVPLRKTASR